MSVFPEGNAIVYCEGAFSTPCGKTAHGLVRRTSRYHLLSVVDSHHAGSDAGLILDRKPVGIAVHRNIRAAAEAAAAEKRPATHLVIGLAPDGGRLSVAARKDILGAVDVGLHVDSGLHDFLSEDEEIRTLADRRGVVIRDVRRTPPRKDLHFFSGKITEVTSLKVALLGTDSAVGKRTTAWFLLDALRQSGYSAELIGTGQTAWMQGVHYGIILDSLINDFVAGEIEHAVWTAWKERRPDVVLIEGQGSLMNPAYPGGFEILAAGRPDVVILQHAPARKEYDGFPGYALHPLDKQIQAVEFLSGKPVVALSVNHEGLDRKDISAVSRRLTEETGLPACDVLLGGTARLIQTLEPYLRPKV